MTQSKEQDAPPSVVIIAGPNGAGKSTTAPYVLRQARIDHFVNADTIAAGLSAFAPETVALKAGSIMLDWLKELASTQSNFAFETTLASKSYASWMKKLKESGYQTHLFFIWLPSEEIAINRVKRRVESGGHDIPENTIRRRFHAGLRNFKNLYMDVFDHWRIIDGSNSDSMGQLIAIQKRNQPRIVLLPDKMKLIEKAWQ